MRPTGDPQDHAGWTAVVGVVGRRDRSAEPPRPPSRCADPGRRPWRRRARERAGRGGGNCGEAARLGSGVLTRWEVLQPAPADDGAGQAEEGLVDVVADLPADPQPPEPVQQREGLLYDPAVGTQDGTMLCAAAGDHGRDALLQDLLAVLVVVIA